MEKLEHSGILGMRWGHRRTPEELGHEPSSGRKRVGSSRSGTSSAVKRQKVGDLTTQELVEKLNRLDLEKRYNDHMSKRSPIKTSWAAKRVDNIISAGVEYAGKQALKAVADAVLEKMRSRR